MEDSLKPRELSLLDRNRYIESALDLAFRVSSIQFFVQWLAHLTGKKIWKKWNLRAFQLLDCYVFLSFDSFQLLLFVISIHIWAPNSNWYCGEVPCFFLNFCKMKKTILLCVHKRVLYHPLIIESEWNSQIEKY